MVLGGKPPGRVGRRRSSQTFERAVTATPWRLFVVLEPFSEARGSGEEVLELFRAREVTQARQAELAEASELLDQPLDAVVAR